MERLAQMPSGLTIRSCAGRRQLAFPFARSDHRGRLNFTLTTDFGDLDFSAESPDLVRTKKSWLLRKRRILARLIVAC
jgi:hypothetical protein